MNNLIGQSLSRYHILEKLGEGGMAMVYKAYDTHLENEVAVKVIRLDNLPRNAEERALKRFEREAKEVAKLDHPNIVKITDYGEHEGSPYLVMPYLSGGTLKQYLREHGPVRWKDAARMLIPVASALEYAHKQKLIHRDVKPSNILLTTSGDPMLSDFGVAKVLGDEVTQDLTGTSATVGTPEYMAPEQVMSKTVDHRADIYALGVVFYEMVTGRRPYEADTPMAVLVMHTRDPLPRPKALVPDLPDGVERVLLKALAKNPDDRYPDMAAFAVALEGLERGQQSFTSVAATVAPVIEPAAETFATYDQHTVEKTKEQEEKAAVTPEVAKLAQPAPAAPTAPVSIKTGRILAIIGGIAVVALLVIGAMSGWFTPRPAASAPTSAPVIAVMTASTLTALPPTATKRPPTITSIPPTPTKSLEIGSTMVSPKDGMTMVYVPAGEFEMGSPEDVGNDDEHPQHTVYLDAYWIDQTEVTNAMFVDFLNKNGRGNATEGGVWWLQTHPDWHPYFRIFFSEGSWEVKNGYEHHPVTDVTWYGANAYCQWADRRLPSEAQWEYAARGTDGRTYPWGNNAPTCHLANYSMCEGGTQVVGSYVEGQSPFNLYDMAGNVEEWVADWYDKNYYSSSTSWINPIGPSQSSYKVFRGGPYNNIYEDFIRSTRRRADIPVNTGYDLGFRCALSASETP